MKRGEGNGEETKMTEKVQGLLTLLGHLKRLSGCWRFSKEKIKEKAKAK